MTLVDIKKQFPVFAHEKELTYLDTAATALVPQRVIDAMNGYYAEYPANIHRGMYPIAERATQAYDHAREVVAEFIHADPTEVIFTSGATQGVNILAMSLANELHVGDNIVLTRYEHHANLIPWITLAKERDIELRFIELQNDYTIDLESARTLIDESTKIVSVGLVSNTLGLIAPIQQIIEYAKQVQAITIIDAAQAVPHMPVDVRTVDCDFLVFSGHKLYGPTGIGVLYGKKEQLNALPPLFTGGDMVKEVSYTSARWADLPNKFEAGTPNIAGAIGLAAAIQFVQDIGWNTMQEHEKELIDYTYTALSSVASVIGPSPEAERIGVFSFVMPGIHPHDIADILGQSGIAVRAGHHCTQPLMNHLQLVGTTRVSLGMYTTTQDIDKLVTALQHVRGMFHSEK